MYLRRSFFIVVGALLFSIPSISQTAPNQGTATAPTPPAAASEAPEQPQKEMPPDTKAPPPIPSAKPQSDSIPPPATPEASQPGTLNAGTEIRAILDTPLSTKTSKVGDRFTATVSIPVRGAIGNVIIPAGSKLNGQVSDSDNERVADAIRDMGHLNLRFTDIQLPNGTDVPVNATLISVHNTKPTARSESQPAPSIATNTGMTGAFGPPLKGLAVGNLAGGGYVLATNGRQVNLPAECGLKLRVDRNTLVP